MPKQEQLTQEQSARFGGYLENSSYDLAGNVTFFKSGPTLAYNAANQNQAVMYDHNGNPKLRGTAALRYDPENRLVQYGASWSAGYTGDGLRAWKQVGSSLPTYSFYDGGLPVLETDSSGTVLAVNTFGPNGLLSRRLNGATGPSVYYTFDPQGNTAQGPEGGDGDD